MCIFRELGDWKHFASFNLTKLYYYVLILGNTKWYLHGNSILFNLSKNLTTWAFILTT